MKYQDWKNEQQAQILKKRNIKLYELGFFDEKVLKKLPDLEVLDDSTPLIYFKKDGNYGFYEELIENEAVYSYRICTIEALTEEQYLDVVANKKEHDYKLIGNVFEGTGWVLASISLILFLVVFFTALSSGIEFLASAFYAGPYFVAVVVSVIIIAIGRSFKCKDIS